MREVAVIEVGNAGTNKCLSDILPRSDNVTEAVLVGVFFRATIFADLVWPPWTYWTQGFVLFAFTLPRVFWSSLFSMNEHNNAAEGSKLTFELCRKNNFSYLIVGLLLSSLRSISSRAR